jgi:hypothetical protein
MGFTFYAPGYGAYEPGWQPLEKNDADHQAIIYDQGMAPKHYAPAQIGFMRNVTRKCANITVDPILAKILKTPNKSRQL